MFDATLPSEVPTQGMQGIAEVTFRHRAGQTRLAHLHQVSPLRVLFPHVPDGEIPQAALVTTSGGIVGGDGLVLRLEAGEDCRVQFMAQAAEKVYRSAGADARIEVDLTAAPNAWLEYLPQETILFEGSRLRRRTRLNAAENARMLAGEMIVFGRTAMKETVTKGLLREAWEVRQNGKLIWADAQHLDGDIASLLAAPAGFGGALSSATILLLCPEPARHLEAMREIMAEMDRASATVVNGLLLLRWLSDDAAVLRRNFAAAWSHLRSVEAGLPAQLPRLWHV